MRGQRRIERKGHSMIARVLALAAVMVLMSAVNVQAQDEDEYEEEFDYTKDSATYMELNLSGAYFDINGDNRGSGGVGATIGAHVDAIGMEVQYDFFDYSATHIATYNLRYTFSNDQLQPWAKAGIGIMGGRPSHPFLLAGRFEAGVNWFLNEQWALAPVAGYAVAPRSNHIVYGSLHVVYYFE